jgi:predicted acylesterase/phospholipase RssA
MVRCPLFTRFDLVFGTSTGAIIGALIALGYSVDDIHNLYRDHVPRIMTKRTRKGRSRALRELADSVFGHKKFDAVKTGLGIVATRWVHEKPMIFKANVVQAHGRAGTFTSGFGCTISDAVQASCSAYPLFKRKTIMTEAGDKVELIDGGYCANNPTLYAIADATVAMKVPHADLRVVSIGVGVYPSPRPKPLRGMAMKLAGVKLLQKTLEINTQSMDQLRTILYKDIRTIRISDTFEKPEMATDFLEHNLDKLNMLRQRGSESFASKEPQLREFLL